MKRGHVPIRTCKGCGKKASRDELSRFILVHGVLVKDQNRGHGLYCCPDSDCRAKIEKRLRKQKNSSRQQGTSKNGSNK